MDVLDENDTKIGTTQVEREWSVPFNRYDDILHSMMTFFEISTLEMWPGMMYNAIDSVGLDEVPV